MGKFCWRYHLKGIIFAGASSIRGLFLYLASKYSFMKLTTLNIASCLLFLNLFACDAPASQKKVSFYFDLENFIDQQVSLLDSLNPEVEKTIRDADSTYQKILKIKSWAQELSIFRKADINQPILEGKYQVKPSPDGITYKAKETDLKTQILQLKYHPDTKTAKKIQVKVVAQNVIFRSEKTLEIVCDPRGKLLKYHIKGQQNAALSADRKYDLEGRLIY